VARNRRRAAERKGRQRPEDANGAPEERLHREEQPGSLDHASGEVDEVEARIVAGAGGEPSPLAEGEPVEEELLESEELDDDDLEELEEDDEPAARPARDGRARRERVPATTAAGAPTTGGGGPRFLQFLRASWAELKRVQWPDRRQVAQATAVVLGFVVVAGAFLGAIDALAKQLVDLII
jgi:preprotein translocase subunit SecE